MADEYFALLLSFLLNTVLCLIQMSEKCLVKISTNWNICWNFEFHIETLNEKKNNNNKLVAT